MSAGCGCYSPRTNSVRSSNMEFSGTTFTTGTMLLPRISTQSTRKPTSRVFSSRDAIPEISARFTCGYQNSTITWRSHIGLWRGRQSTYGSCVQRWRKLDGGRSGCRRRNDLLHNRTATCLGLGSAAKTKTARRFAQRRVENERSVQETGVAKQEEGPQEVSPLDYDNVRSFEDDDVDSASWSDPPWPKFPRLPCYANPTRHRGLPSSRKTTGSRTLEPMNCWS